ncbi:MAG: hypothetical protein AMXMBFR56_47150 [Polyangiaceae bacterium]
MHGLPLLVFLPFALFACGSRSGLPEPPVVLDVEAGVPEECGVPPGQAEVLAKLDFQPASIAVSGAWVFAAAWSFEGKVVRVPTGGGAAVVIASGQPAVNQLASEGAAAYWVTQGLGGTDGAVIRSTALGTETFAGGLTRPQGVALYGSQVYFTDGVGPPGNGRVMRKPKSGGAVETLGSALGEPWDVAVNAGGVYFSNVAGDGTIQRVPHTGGKSTVLASGYWLPRNVALDGTFVHWSAMEPDQLSSVYRCPESGGATELLHAALGSVEGIAADAQGAYWGVRQSPANPTYGAVFTSGPKALLESGDFSVMGVAIDQNAVYFTTIDADGAGSVRKTCRR